MSFSSSLLEYLFIFLLGQLAVLNVSMPPFYIGLAHYIKEGIVNNSINKQGKDRERDRSKQQSLTNKVWNHFGILFNRFCFHIILKQIYAQLVEISS